VTAGFLLSALSALGFTAEDCVLAEASGTTAFVATQVSEAANAITVAKLKAESALSAVVANLKAAGLDLSAEQLTDSATVAAKIASLTNSRAVDMVAARGVTPVLTTPVPGAMSASSDDLVKTLNSLSGKEKTSFFDKHAEQFKAILNRRN